MYASKVAAGLTQPPSPGSRSKLLTPGAGLQVATFSVAAAAGEESLPNAAPPPAGDAMDDEDLQRRCDRQLSLDDGDSPRPSSAERQKSISCVAEMDVEEAYHTSRPPKPPTPPNVVVDDDWGQYADLETTQGIQYYYYHAPPRRGEARENPM